MNNKKSNPSLSDTLNLLKRDIFLSLNCHAIGTIEGFNPLLQTASVSINYTKTNYEAQNDGSFKSVAQDYPKPLLDLPVIILQGGSASLTFPIQVGDECLILFNDRDIDNWAVDGITTQSPNSQRAHSMSDGIVLIGLNPNTDPLLNYDVLHAMLQWEGGGKIGVSASRVLIANAQPQSLGSLLAELINEIQNMNANNAALATALAQPAIAAALTAQGVLMTATAAKISELLE